MSDGAFCARVSSVIALVAVAACDQGGVDSGGLVPSGSTPNASSAMSGAPVPLGSEPVSVDAPATAPRPPPSPGPTSPDSIAPTGASAVSPTETATPMPQDSAPAEVSTPAPGASAPTAGASPDDEIPQPAPGEADASTPPSADADLPALQPPAERVSFGTALDAAEVMTTARQSAQTLADPTRAEWRAKGDQHRVYHSDQTNQDEPYRLYVPTTWDGASRLPLVMFLHGAGSDENTYVDQNGKQMLELVEEHGFVLVSPLGASGAYGNFLRLSAPFGEPEAAADLVAQVTEESMRTNELSEMDVINVLELVLAEYPIDHSSLFLTGHSMGSGGTWYVGGKYSTYWRAIAPMSGPFVQETGYPWDNLRQVSIFVTEGVQTPSLEGSQRLAAWLTDQGFDARYLEVDADHAGMVPLVLPEVFTFFKQARSN